MISVIVDDVLTVFINVFDVLFIKFLQIIKKKNGLCQYGSYGNYHHLLASSIFFISVKVDFKFLFFASSISSNNSLMHQLFLFASSVSVLLSDIFFFLTFFFLHLLLFPFFLFLSIYFVPAIPQQTPDDNIHHPQITLSLVCRQHQLNHHYSFFFSSDDIFFYVIFFFNPPV